MSQRRIHGPPLFEAEGPAYYAAALKHNQGWATHQAPWQTELTSGEESRFREWLANHRKEGHNPGGFDPDAEKVDYDMRGFWKATHGTDQEWNGGHFPDTWKTPYDTSFSAESKYAKRGCPFRWVGEILVNARTGRIIFAEQGARLLDASFVTEPELEESGVQKIKNKSKENEKGKGKEGKKEKSSKEKRRERRRNRKLDKRDRNVAIEYGPKHKVGFLDKLRYRATLIHSGNREEPGREVDITGVVTMVSWEEPGITATGSITVQSPDPIQKLDRKYLVGDGDLIKLDGWWGGRWRNVFVMRTKEPNDELATREGTFALADDSELVGMSEGDFKFKKEKKSRPQGWKCHQIAIAVAREWRFPIGHVAKGIKDITNLVEHGVSPLDVISKAYKEERDYTGRRFVFSWKHGRLNITKLRRNPILYSLREQIIAATVSRNRGPKFFTALELTATLKGEKDEKGKGKKLTAMVASQKAVRRYGYIRKQHKLKRSVKSRQEMVDIGRRIIAKKIREHTLPSIELTHPGIPWIRRGDAIEIDLPEYGFTHKPRSVPPFQGGDYDIVFVNSIAHAIDSTGHTMTLGFTIKDPVAEQAADEREARDKQRREAKHKTRKNKKSEKAAA